MPKKTKKEKIIAEYRRKLQTVQFVNPKTEFTNHLFKQTPQQQPLAHIAPLPVLSTKPLTPENTSEIIAIKHDLIKTLILASIAITIELLLYYRLGK